MSEFTYTYAELQAILKQSESVGYLKALDDVKAGLGVMESGAKLSKNQWVIEFVNSINDYIETLRSDYEKGKDEDGK
jgi:hypothetical protein